MRQLIRPYGALRFDRLHLSVTTNIAQTRMDFDRAQKFDMLVAVEHFLTRQRLIVEREATSDGLRVTGLPPAREGEEDDADVLKNGMLFRLITEPWVFMPKTDVSVEGSKPIVFSLPSWAVTVGGVSVPQGASEPSPTAPHQSATSR